MCACYSEEGPHSSCAPKPFISLMPFAYLKLTEDRMVRTQFSLL
uniref:Uncharacterized protein n=1 Tax=Anguilla anguilla TaxID=7936 RepID=A0A0E9SM67_ANGAN